MCYVESSDRRSFCLQLSPLVSSMTLTLSIKNDEFLVEGNKDIILLVKFVYGLYTANYCLFVSFKMLKYKFETLSAI